MKRTSLSLVFLLISVIIKAQVYQLDFSSSGAAITVDSIFIQNLNQNTQIALAGNDTLELVGSVLIEDFNQSTFVNIYPNPMDHYANLNFSSNILTSALIEIVDIQGKICLSKRIQLDAGMNNFQISGLLGGYYIVIIKTANDNTYVQKLVSTNTHVDNPQINKTGQVFQKEFARTKSAKNIYQLAYNQGDRLLLKAVSGNYSRVLTIVPTQSQTIDFEFVPCTDLQGNNYAVVTINGQTWMAENLKYLPNIHSASDFVSVGLDSLPAYGVYDYNGNDINAARSHPNYDIYGALYNWHAVDKVNICPVGWHVPSNIEWAALVNYLSGPSEAGKKLKETDSLHWAIYNNGTNEYGFTALPAGYRDYVDGSYETLGTVTAYWTNTASDAYFSYIYMITHNQNHCSALTDFKPFGYSVRCIKDL